MKGHGRIFLVMLVLAMVAAGCAAMMEPAPTLYERLTIRQPMPGGFDLTLRGRDTIAAIVDDFVANMVANPTTKARFDFKEWPQTKALIAKGLPPPLANLQVVSTFKAHLADQICEAAGGSCSYAGRDMKTAHTGMSITEAEWSATVDAFAKALDKRKVLEKEKNELLGLLGPLKKDIVGQ